MDVVTQVISVTSETTRNGRVKYNVTTGMGTYAVWDGQLAQQLVAYAGQGPVTLNIRQKPSNDGQRMWEDIQSFMPGGMQPGTPQPQLASQPSMPQQIQQVQPQRRGGGGGFDPATTTRITKLAALNYASVLVAGLMQGAGPEGVAQATSLVQSIAAEFYKAARSHEEAAQQPAAPQPVSGWGQGMGGAQIASNVPGVQLGAPGPAADDPYGPQEAGDDPVTGSDSGWD